MFSLVIINRQTFKALIDLGATLNVMSPRTAAVCNARLNRKLNPYLLVLVDGEPHNEKGSIVDKETEELSITFAKGHTKRIRFDVVSLGQHQIVLRSP